MTFRLSRRAIAQVVDIARYTDRTFGANQAEKYLRGLYQAFELLGRNPDIGVRFNDTHRRYVYRSHHIYYRNVEDVVLIVMIRNGRQAEPTL